MAQQPVAYHCSPGITWVKDAGLTLLVERERGRSWSLQGAEAAIWDLMVLAYPFQEIAQFVHALVPCGAKEASEFLVGTLREWEAQGIIYAAEGAQDG